MIVAMIPFLVLFFVLSALAVSVLLWGIDRMNVPGWMRKIFEE